MDRETQPVDGESTSAAASPPLAKSFARSSVYNLIGWAWPILLSIVSVPYIVRHLGDELYGVYGVISIVAGYLAMVSTPTASGNVRFLATAYGYGDWSGLRRQLFDGVLVNAAIAVVAGAIIFFVAPILVTDVFRISDALTDAAILAFRIGASSDAVNGIAASMRSLPIAVRRYDLVNGVTLVSGTANTVFVIIAIYQGYSLVGAVVAQTLSSLVALIGFGTVMLLLLNRMPRVASESALRRAREAQDAEIGMKKLVKYSGLLFVEHVLSQLGIRIDRTLVGIMLGATAVTYYVIPSRITDIIPGIVGVVVAQMYPLMAEAVATRRIDEAKMLYDKVQRIMLWIVCLLVTALIVNAYDLISVWIDVSTADKSWLILVLLSIVAVTRAPASLSFQTAVGMGRADLTVYLGIATLALPMIGVPLLISYFGLSGAAIAMVATLAPAQIVFAALVQRRLLQRERWWSIAGPLVRSYGTSAVVTAVVFLMPVPDHSLAAILVRTASIAALYTVLSLALGSLKREDVRDVSIVVSSRVKAVRS